MMLNSGQAVSGATLAAIDAAYRTLGGEVLGLIPDELAQAVAHRVLARGPARDDPGHLRELMPLHEGPRLLEALPVKDQDDLVDQRVLDAHLGQGLPTPG